MIVKCERRSCHHPCAARPFVAGHGGRDEHHHRPGHVWPDCGSPPLPQLPGIVQHPPHHHACGPAQCAQVRAVRRSALRGLHAVRVAGPGPIPCQGKGLCGLVCFLMR